MTLVNLACILRQLSQGIQRVDFWRYRLSLSINDVNDSMNDSVTVLMHFLWLSIISTHTVVTLFYLLIYLLLGMHNTTVSNCDANFESHLSILILGIDECNKCDHIIRLYFDCTANYGHALFLWNICAGGLLPFLETRKAFADTFVLKKKKRHTNCVDFELRNLCFYWVDDVCILCMMNLLFSKPPLRCSIIPRGASV